MPTASRPAPPPRRARTVLWALGLVVAACAPLPDPAAGPVKPLPNGGPKGMAPLSVPQLPGTGVRPSDEAAHAFAIGFLDALQPKSVAERREYCGYFYTRSDGAIAATPPRPGTFATCDMPAPDPRLGVFASYHTHGAFGPGYDNEVPSVTDLLSDFDFGIDGYVSTPGGRVWHVDFGSRTTRQVCGLRCVTADPRFRPVGEGAIRTSYGLPGLARRASGF